MTCRFPDCHHPVERGDLCQGHRKQQVRGQRLTPLRERVSATEMVIVAASDMVEAELDEAYEKAKGRVLAAALAMAREKGWRPPEVGAGAALPSVRRRP